jgi:hypothetical protein
MTPEDPTATPVPAALRCSNTDRERTCAVLHEAAGDGRLTIAETEERLTLAYRARYGHELAALTADLPAGAATLTGWPHVASTARDQLVADVAVLIGRRPGSPGQRTRTLLIAVVVVLLVAGAIALLMHGIIADGPEYGPETH